MVVLIALISCGKTRDIFNKKQTINMPSWVVNPKAELSQSNFFISFGYSGADTIDLNERINEAEEDAKMAISIYISAILANGAENVVKSVNSEQITRFFSPSSAKIAYGAIKNWLSGSAVRKNVYIDPATQAVIVRVTLNADEILTNLQKLVARYSFIFTKEIKEEDVGKLVQGISDLVAGQLKTTSIKAGVLAGPEFNRSVLIDQKYKIMLNK
jgi:hypothetical protein